MSSYAQIPAGYDGRFYAPALEEMVRLLRLLGGDPQTIDRAIFFEQGNVTDAAAVKITRVQAQAENFSILQIQFAQTSGLGRWLATGAIPTAGGFGMPILSGGALLTIRGVDNINNFQMIAETGQAMQYNATLYKAQAWMGTKP